MSEFNILNEKFELYDRLYEECKTITEACDLHQLMAGLRTLDRQGHQIVGLLIQKYTQSKSIPYGGKQVNSIDVKFDVREFDLVLQHILLTFCKLEAQKKYGGKKE